MLKEKIQNKQKGILLYGLTPPKINYGEERIAQIAIKQMKRIQELKVDGIILYDIQDEASRTNEKRPFPFLQTVEPSLYAQKYLHVNKPKIIYKAVGKYDKNQLQDWLSNSNTEFCVFVGASSKNQKISLCINEAYKIKEKTNKHITLGAVAIPERHHIKKDEHIRIFEKMQKGCQFFVTQAIYDKKVAKEFLCDYVEFMQKNNMQIVPIILTLTPCGTIKTLEFMKWLGISVPKYLEDELRNSDDILEKSINLCIENFKYLYEFGIKKGIPIGCNVESVAVKKEEIEASVELISKIKDIMK